MSVVGQGKGKTAVFPYSTVHKPHGEDESHGAKHTDRREILNSVETVFLQNRECSGIGECNRGHIEGHTQRIERDEERLVGQFLSEATLTAQPPAAQHETACQQMAQAQQALRLDILVSNNTHQGRHKNTHDTLNGVEPGDLVAESGYSKIVAHTGEIGSPDGKLQEVHQ